MSHDLHQRAAMLRLARQYLLPYCLYTDPAQAHHYQATHLIYLMKVLQRVEAGEILRLMIFMPNRHWKSSTVSKKFVSWFIGKRRSENKPHEVMLISHTGDKADEFSEYSRNLARDRDSQGHSLYSDVFPAVKISRTRQSAREWGLLDDNGMEEPYATVTTGSMMAPPTGSGADLLLIDDPLKSATDARSKTIQKAHLANFDQGLDTRLNDPKTSAIILMMTRWAMHDLAGQLLKRAANDPNADQWTVICLPALAYSNQERTMARRAYIPVPDTDPLGRRAGEALWPERFPREYHLKKKANSPTAFYSIGQQMPIQEGGNLLGREAFKFLESAPTKHIEWVIGTDWAVSAKQIAGDDPDYHVVGLIGKWWPSGDPNDVNLVLASLVRTQMGVTMGKEMLVRFAEAMSQLLGRRVPIIFPPANIDTVIISDLRGHNTLLNWRLRSLKDPSLKRQVGAFKGDKAETSGPWRDRAEDGRFYVVHERWSHRALKHAFAGSHHRRIFGDEPLAWHEKFFAEVEGFPNWAHDDMVDHVSVGAHALALSGHKKQMTAIQKPQGWFA